MVYLVVDAETEGGRKNVIGLPRAEEAVFIRAAQPLRMGAGTSAIASSYFR